MKRLLTIAALPAVLAHSALSQAQDSGREVHGDDEVWERPFAVEGVLGLGTPVGYAGVAIDYSPAPLLAISIGAGLGSGTENTDCLESGVVGVCNGPIADRLQLAAMSRFRIVRKRHSAWSLGAGVSGGGYSWDEFTTDQPSHKTSDRAYWLNLELGGEYRASSGFSARGFIGYARMLNPGSLECIDTGVNSDHCPQDHQGDGEGLIYLGAALGWAF